MTAFLNFGKNHIFISFSNKLQNHRGDKFLEILGTIIDKHKFLKLWFFCVYSSSQKNLINYCRIVFCLWIVGLVWISVKFRAKISDIWESLTSGLANSANGIFDFSISYLSHSVRICKFFFQFFSYCRLNSR